MILFYSFSTEIDPQYHRIFYNSLALESNPETIFADQKVILMQNLTNILISKLAIEYYNFFFGSLSF